MCSEHSVFSAAVVCWLAVGYVSAQARSADSPDALELLQKSSQQYVALTSYKIIEEETVSSDHPPDPAPSVMLAIEAPSHRYRFEADIGLGNDVRVSDGHFAWFYRPQQRSYTQTLADPARDTGPDISKSLWADEGGIVAASQLRELAQFVADYKSALRLSDASITVRGHSFECYVVELSNDDLRTPQPYPFMETVWIEKGSFKIRKIVENFITTSNSIGEPPVTFPATRTITYPEVTLNEPIPDSAFQFAPPAGAHVVTEFPDHVHHGASAAVRITQAPDVTLRSLDGQQVQFSSFRGRPVLIDMWATWCAPCVYGFRDLARLYEETHQTGLTILSIDVSDDAKTAQVYLRKMGYQWPNFHDSGEVESAFGPSGIPRSIVIDPDGRITFDRMNPTAEEVRKAIANLGPEYSKALAVSH